VFLTFRAKNFGGERGGRFYSLVICFAVSRGLLGVGVGVGVLGFGFFGGGRGGGRRGKGGRD